MLDFTESVEINATPEDVWALLRDIEAWWVASNADHDSLEVLSSGPLRKGSRIRVRESIAGIPGVADGVVTKLQPEESITWEAAQARYRLYGFALHVHEAVEWTIDPHQDGQSTLSAHVWAEFPKGPKGWMAEWVFRHILDGVERDRAHARSELLYLKRQLEGEKA